MIKYLIYTPRTEETPTLNGDSTAIKNTLVAKWEGEAQKIVQDLITKNKAKKKKDVDYRGIYYNKSYGIIGLCNIPASGADIGNWRDYSQGFYLHEKIQESNTQELKQALALVNQTIQTNKQEQGSKNTEVSRLIQNIQQDIVQKQASLTAELAKKLSKEEFATAKASLATKEELETKLEGAKTDVEVKVQEKITKLAKQISDGVDQITIINESTSSASSDISGLKTKVNTNTSDIANLKAKDTQLEQNINSATTNITRIDRELTSAKASIQSHTTELSQTKSKAEQALSKASAVETKITTATNEVSSLKSKATSLESAINTAKSDITNLKQSSASSVNPENATIKNLTVTDSITVPSSILNENGRTLVGMATPRETIFDSNGTIHFDESHQFLVSVAGRVKGYSWSQFIGTFLKNTWNGFTTSLVGIHHLYGYEYQEHTSSTPLESIKISNKKPSSNKAQNVYVDLKNDFTFRLSGGFFGLQGVIIVKSANRIIGFHQDIKYDASSFNDLNGVEVFVYYCLHQDLLDPNASLNNSNFYDKAFRYNNGGYSSDIFFPTSGSVSNRLDLSQPITNVKYILTRVNYKG